MQTLHNFIVAVTITNFSLSKHHQGPNTFTIVLFTIDRYMYMYVNHVVTEHCVYVYMYVCMCVLVCICMHMYAYVCVCMSVYVCVCVYVCACVYVHMF